MSNEEFKKNIKTISNNDLLEQVEFMSDGYYFELVDVCLEELRCRLDAIRWHYPSRGEYPTESGDFLCCFYGLTSFKVGWYDKNDQSWCFENCIYYKDGADNIIAWQYIIPPKEEA